MDLRNSESGVIYYFGVFNEGEKELNLGIMNSTSNMFGIFFRVFHPSLDSQCLVDGVGMVATREWSAGEARCRPGGELLGGIRKESYATFDIISFGAVDLEGSFSSVIRFIREKQGFISQIVAGGGRCEIFISGIIDTSWGEIITPELLRTMGEYGVSLALDILPAADECRKPGIR
jgi:hypothetical protein